MIPSLFQEIYYSTFPKFVNDYLTFLKTIRSLTILKGDVIILFLMDFHFSLVFGILAHSDNRMPWLQQCDWYTLLPAVSTSSTYYLEPYSELCKIVFSK